MSNILETEILTRFLNKCLFLSMRVDSEFQFAMKYQSMFIKINE